ncbi:small subunit of carbamoyl phosphate synthase [Acaromyces ingoldii]|uniref:Carbamoyl phosphate synthase arginine-specific small chain n=1 Tax=Acaromyces ingoldii TaxID=215250 RepID=A0A316YS84_9BASI|nr:small subunit of carbamoyl phosphate synthase [Acaromyces ingoldii]PWN92420.1 small subunit of carbamoyl phosphate synthase [Acaromyces ingoldii]
MISSATLFRSGACFRAPATRFTPSLTRGLATTINYTAAPASQPATLHLKSGHKFEGQSFGAPRSSFGETVFTTSITSYTESLTDPSYQGQLLAFTQPLMGNYGVPDNFCGKSPMGHPLDVDVGSFLESQAVQASGVIVSNLAERFSHFEAVESLSTWCARYNVPGIAGIDTRALTTLLRNQGSTLGAIKVGKDHDVAPNANEFFDPMAENLIARVSTKEPYTVHPIGGSSKARAHVALLDFGCKANIVRCLIREGASVTVLPWNFDFNSVRDQFDGLFLSNGPGSPYSIPEAIETTKRAIDEWDRPIFGICMGNQIIGIAAGLKAFRMKFGNRGANQPVVKLSTGRVYITSQNHGYAIEHNEDEKWPDMWVPWYVNANDGTIEGIISHADSGKNVRSAQFHPESRGGPEDTYHLFKEWVDDVAAVKAKKGLEKPALGLDPSLLGKGPFEAIKTGAPSIAVAA